MDQDEVYQMIWPDDYINKVIQGDCLEVIKGIPDKSIGLIVTSPPYDNLRDYQGYNFDFEGIAKQLFRTTKDGGVVVWIVGDQTINGSETGTSFKQALYFKDLGFNLHDTMIYEKDSSPFPETNRYYPSFEYMFICSKGKPKTTNLLKDKINLRFGENVSHSTQREKDGTTRSVSAKKTNPNKTIKEFGIRKNVWKYSPGMGKSTKDIIAYNHPAIFPEGLAGDHILSWSNEGDIVLDPLSGSGTTCKMAKKYKRNFIGIEIHDGYCEIARQRLRQEILL